MRARSRGLDKHSGGLTRGDDSGETHSLGKNSPGKQGGTVTRLRRQCAEYGKYKTERPGWRKEARDDGEKAEKRAWAGLRRELGSVKELIVPLL